jgi:hypothetical protein
LVFRGNLPTSLSPYGSWDDEAIEEILQGWLERRLLRGGLLAILDRAVTPAGFRRLAERSLRQWLLNERERSYSQNLYARMARMLEEDEEVFHLRQQESRPQDVWWTTRAARDANLFSGAERDLASAAWSLGDFALLRHNEQERLSPLLSGEDIRRFVIGMFEATGCALTLNQLTGALKLRFDLRAPVFEALPADDELVVGSDRVADDAVLRDTAKTVLGELTARQADVLLGTRAGESLDSLAQRHSCSPATIYNEQRRIASIVLRYSENNNERDRLLKIAGDLLYEDSAA